MAIPQKCVCGAVLEIDDRFRGQKIPCPDCNRLLDTSPPPPPPRTTSAWAVASLIFPLAGMLTLIGPVAGIFCGLAFMRRQRQDPSLGGLAFARAGIGLGAIFTALSFWAILAPEFLGLDGMLRVFLSSRDLRVVAGKRARSLPLNNESRVVVNLPGGGWGQWTSKDTERGELLTLVHPWDDSQIVCFSLLPDKEEDARSKAIQRFLETELVKNLSRTKDVVPAFPEPSQIRPLDGDEKDANSQLFRVDLTLAAIPRVFLFRMLPNYVVVAGTRKSRFSRLEESLKNILDSFQLDKGD